MPSSQLEGSGRWPGGRPITIGEDAMNEIVVGTDGSELSLHAVGWAAREAVRHDQALRIVHALQPWLYETPPDSPHAPAGQLARKGASGLLADAAAHAHQEATTVQVSTELLAGDARSALLDRARKASMLIIGGRGVGGFAGLILGSVAHAVASTAECPVVVVRGPVMNGARDVVVGVDDSPRSYPALEIAFAEAAVRRSTVRAVHAWRRPIWAPHRPPAPPSARLGGPPTSEDAARQLLTAAVAGWIARYPEVDVVEHLDEGHPADVLVRASADADLVVVGRRGAGGFPGLRLGSTSRGLLHHALCPVMLVPGQPGAWARHLRDHAA